MEKLYNYLIKQHPENTDRKQGIPSYAAQAACRQGNILFFVSVPYR